MPTEHDTTPTNTTIGVALSGGGHRASVFGLGVLLYLADVGKNANVTNIASVSGGSITNGFVAAHSDYSQCPKNEFASKVAAPLAGQICQRGTLFAPLTTKLYLLAVLVSIVATMVGPWFLPVDRVLQLVAFAVGVVWTSWLAGQRGNVCGAAYRKTLFSGRSIQLSDLDRAASPVICSTDLRTGRQVYFGSRFIYGYSIGWAVPSGVPLHKTIQASAAFPGGFPPTRLSTRLLDFRSTRDGEPKKWKPRQLVLADGGLYDNMADQWVRGFASRTSRWKWLGRELHSPDELIVVNSAARINWTSFHARIPIWGELATIMRDMNVLYENTTAVRRQDLVERFDAAEKTGEGLRGGFVMIGQSPYGVADDYARQEQAWPHRFKRAGAVQKWLGPDNRDKWKQIAKDNSAVPTTLRALGTTDGARLLYHAYVLAMCNLHVLLDYPLLDPPSLSRFEQLAQGRVSPQGPGQTGSSIA